MKEVWRPVPGWEERYEVSNTGRVRSFAEIGSRSKRIEKPRILSAVKNPHGYRYVYLSRRSHQHTTKVGKLVLLAFIGERPKGKEVSHIDGNSSNDLLSNLIYETHTQNVARRIDFGGENHSQHKLTAKQVRKIFSLKNSGIGSRAIGRNYGVVSNTILRIWNGKGWKNLNLFREEA
jgi:hypothetical protein